MAKSWAEMSKEERKGKNKKDYMRSTGQGVQGERAAAKEKAQARQEEQSQQKKPDVPEMVKHHASGKMIRNPALLNKHEQAAVDKRNAEKQQANQYNNLAKRMGEMDAQRRHMSDDEYKESQGQFKDEFSAANKNMSSEQRRSFNQLRQQTTKNARQVEVDAYKQSIAEVQAEKAKYGPTNVYGRQSARNTHEGSMAKGNSKVTGPRDQASESMRERNRIADELYDSGYDYSHNEMLRHYGGGKENKSMPGLYDEYGGYQNWYDNHSLYSGNFSGSKDLMDFDKVMETGQKQQDAMKNLQTSDDYMSKYGKYKWAKDYNNRYGQGSN